MQIENTPEFQANVRQSLWIAHKQQELAHLDKLKLRVMPVNVSGAPSQWIAEFDAWVESKGLRTEKFEPGPGQFCSEDYMLITRVPAS